MSLHRSTTGCTPPKSRSCSLQDASSLEIAKPHIPSFGNGGESALLQLPAWFARMSGDTLPEVRSDGKKIARSGLKLPPSSLLREGAGLLVSAAAVSCGSTAGMVVDSDDSSCCDGGVRLEIRCKNKPLSLLAVYVQTFSSCGGQLQCLSWVSWLQRGASTPAGHARRYSPGYEIDV